MIAEEINEAFQNLKWLRSAANHHLRHNTAKQLLSTRQLKEASDQGSVIYSRAALITLHQLKTQFGIQTQSGNLRIEDEAGNTYSSETIAACISQVLYDEYDNLRELLKASRGELVNEVITSGVAALNPGLSSLNDAGWRDIFTSAKRDISLAEHEGRTICEMTEASVVWEDENRDPSSDILSSQSFSPPIRYL